MAKKKNRKKGLGALLKEGSFLSAAMPPAIGGIVAATVTYVLQATIKPDDAASSKIVKYAPLLGAGAGAIVGGVGGYFLSGAKAAGSGSMTGLIVGGSIFGAQRILAKNPLGAAAALADEAPDASAPVVLPEGGTNAIVPQYANQLSGGQNGLNAIVWEQLKGNEQHMGEDVQLRGGLQGLVNTGAFGTNTYGAG